MGRSRLEPKCTSTAGTGSAPRGPWLRVQLLELDQQHQASHCAACGQESSSRHCHRTDH
ncbi:UNVERIFIED_CONTAM: hypothetical protein Sradi_7008200 [Sesamum radiatum]|uniref:Uncharacterized protein n=1 Tax=Sesamum radiatum TaxID=300843 RepID=A0AAW2JCN7_SESRA